MVIRRVPSVNLGAGGLAMDENEVDGRKQWCWKCDFRLRGGEGSWDPRNESLPIDPAEVCTEESED